MELIKEKLEYQKRLLEKIDPASVSWDRVKGRVEAYETALACLDIDKLLK